MSHKVIHFKEIRKSIYNDIDRGGCLVSGLGGSPLWPRSHTRLDIQCLVMGVSHISLCIRKPLKQTLRNHQLILRPSQEVHFFEN